MKGGHALIHADAVLQAAIVDAALPRVLKRPPRFLTYKNI